MDASGRSCRLLHTNQGAQDFSGRRRRQAGWVGQHLRGTTLQELPRAALDLQGVVLDHDTAAAEYDFRPAPPLAAPVGDRKSVGLGKSVSVRVALRGRRIIKKKHNEQNNNKKT